MTEDGGAPADDARATIVLAEDDTDLRKVLAAVLAHAGYKVLEAKTGAEAAFYITSRPVDLLVTDLVMPDMDGVQLIRKLYEFGLSLRLLAITGLSDATDFLDATRGMGALRTLRKPFPNAELLATVEACLAEPARPLRDTWPADG